MTLEVREAEFDLTDSARREITNLIERSGVESAVPGIVWAKWQDEQSYRWHIGVYNREVLEVGWFVRCGDLEIYTYQIDEIRRLVGAVLDYQNGIFRVVDAT